MGVPYKIGIPGQSARGSLLAILANSIKLRLKGCMLAD
jgi:hypothetical protein